MSFDENAPAYRCCCNCIHARVGAVIIGILEVVLLTYKITVSVGEYLILDWLWPLIVTIVVAVLVFVAVVLMISGITRLSHYRIIPHLVVQVVGLFCLLVLLVGGIVAIHLRSDIYSRLLQEQMEKVPKYQNEEQAQWNASRNSVFITTMAGAIIGICLFAGAIELWFLTVIVKAYKYVRDKQAAIKDARNLLTAQGEIPLLERNEKA